MQKEAKISRRAFLAAAGGTIVNIELPGIFVKLSDADQRSLAGQIRPDGLPRIPPGRRRWKVSWIWAARLELQVLGSGNCASMVRWVAQPY